MISCTKLLPLAQIRYFSHINPNQSCFLGLPKKKHSKIELRHADYNKTPLLEHHYEPSHKVSPFYWNSALISQGTSTCNYSAHNTVFNVKLCRIYLKKYPSLQCNKIPTVFRTLM